MQKKIYSVFINTILFLAVSLLVYGAMEWAFPRVFTKIFPMNMATKFDEFDGVWPLFQSSKRSYLPKNYIALAGDSYAMGMGDAMYEPIPNAREPRFGSAHTIQDMTARDVITFGQPGSGSIRGAISNPISGLRYLHSAVDKNFPSPAWLLIYFYEGNDLTENWMYYEQTFLTNHTGVDYENPQVFDQYIQDVALGRQRLYLAANAVTWQKQLFFYRFARRIFAETMLGKKFYRGKYPNELGLIYIPQSRWVPRKVDQPINHALIGGKTVPLPNNLQGPSMDLSQEQLVQTVGTFAKSLAWSRAHFPDTQFAVVFVPSVLSSYQLVGDNVDAQNFFSDNSTQFKVAELEQRHQWIEKEIARVAKEQGVPFVNTTSDIRAAAQDETVHGPRDWNHFSRKGYEVLGQSVVRQLPSLKAEK